MLTRAAGWPLQALTQFVKENAKKAVSFSKDEEAAQEAEDQVPIVALGLLTWDMHWLWFMPIPWTPRPQDRIQHGMCPAVLTHKQDFRTTAGVLHVHVTVPRHRLTRRRQRSWRRRRMT
jgi:hypothetical protein